MHRSVLQIPPFRKAKCKTGWSLWNIKIGREECDESGVTAAVKNPSSYIGFAYRTSRSLRRTQVQLDSALRQFYLWKARSMYSKRSLLTSWNGISVPYSYCWWNSTWYHLAANQKLCGYRLRHYGMFSRLSRKQWPAIDGVVSQRGPE